MVLEILTYPDPRLRQKAKPAAEVTPELKKFAEDMVETMYDSHGIGLAATQVGRDVRLLVVDTRPHKDDGEVDLEAMTELERAVPQPMVVINPEITKSEGKTTYEEGCLSVPTFYETVERFAYIELSYMDVNGNRQSLKTDGLLAICLQHEMDHLDGKLFIDRLSFVKSNRIKTKIKKSGYPTPEEAREEREKVKAARAAAKQAAAE